MKLRVFIPVLLALMAGPALGMEKPYKSYLKPIVGKLPALGAAGLYGFIGWSAYQFIKNPKHKKNYAEDFNALGVRYLKTPEFAQDHYLKQEVQESDYYNEKPQQFDQRTAQWGQKIKDGAIAPLYIACINKKIGNGAFADSDIKEGEFIGTYTGKIYDTFHMPYKESALYGWALPNILGVDGYKQGNELRFVNHSYEPNVTIKYVPVNDQWHVVYIAKRPIVRNEQLLVNYGPNYWRAHGEPKPLNEKYRFYHARDFFKKYFEKIS